MTTTIDPKSIGKPKRPRRHVRTLTGVFMFPSAAEALAELGRLLPGH